MLSLLALAAIMSVPRPEPRWIAPAAAPMAKPSPDLPCPLMRRSFVLESAPTAASIRIIGLGHFELRCNGTVVGDTVIDQPWSEYSKTLYYQDFDLAPLLHKGENVLAVTLGNSFWQVAPANDAQRFTKTDAMPDFSDGWPHLLWLSAAIRTSGGTQTITSDENWKWSEGPLVFSNLYAGEDFDARLDAPGWDAPGFDDSAWKPAHAAPAPKGTPAPSPAPGMKTFDVFKPAEIKRPAPGLFTYVFPQNCSALLRFTVDGGRAGSRIRFKPCEYMDDAGKVKFTYTWGTGKDIWHDYTKRSAGPESHQVLFCYVGAQFVQVEGAVPEGDPNPRGLPVIRSLEQVHVRADCPVVGEFASSSQMHNRAHALVDWSIRSNMAHVPTDCPHREKNGWLEQDWHMARALSYGYDTHGWFTKVCRDIRDTQFASGPDDGFIPTNAPWYLVGRPVHDTYNDAPEWGISGVLVPWHLYEWYGDATVLADSYESARRYVDYLSSTAKDGIITSNLGDWYDFGHGKGNGPAQWTSNELSATATWAAGAGTLARIAAVLDKPEDAARYRALHERIRAAFVARFYDPAARTFKNNGSCQAANSTALCLGLAPEADRDAVLEKIVDDLRARNYQQTSGEVLQVYLIRALAENGRSEVLHRIYNRDEIGSYGYMVKSGLTTLPESWDAHRGTGDSLNHFMLGHLVEWHYAYVCGIRQQPGSVGWKKILIAPQPPPMASLISDGTSRGPEDARNAITSAHARFEAPSGQIESSWEIFGPEFRLTCHVPEGVEALVIMPDGSKHPAAAGGSKWTCKLP